MAIPTWKVPSAPSAGMDTPPSERLTRFTTFMSGLLPFSKKILGAGESPLCKSLVQKSLFSPSDDDKADSTLVSQQKSRILIPAKIEKVSVAATEAAQNLSNSKSEDALSENVSIVAQTAAITSPVPSAADILGIREPRISAQGVPFCEGGDVHLSQENSNSGAEQVPVCSMVDGQVTQSVKLGFVAPDSTAPQYAVSVDFSHVKIENGASAYDRLDMVQQSVTAESYPSMLREEFLGGIEPGWSEALQCGTNLVREKIEHSLLSTCEDTLGQHEELRSGLEGSAGEDDKGWLKVKPELPDLKSHCNMDDEANLDIFGPKVITNSVKSSVKGRKDVQPELTELKTQKVMDAVADIDRFQSNIISSEKPSFRGRKDDPILAYTCHWCRHKAVQEELVECCRCPIRFCGMCLSNRNGEDIIKEKENGALWVCPKCRGGCGPGCDNW